MSKGFTLVELLVGMTVFLVAIIIGTAVFINGLKTERQLVAEMAVNNSANLVLEQIARDIRTGYDFSLIGEERLDFKGRDGENISYNLAPEAAIKRTVGTRGALSMTGTGVNVRVLKFFVHNRGDCDPWRVTIAMRVSPASNLDKIYNIQTTVSSRVLPMDVGREDYAACRS